MDEVQQLADSLAQALHRSVEVDDPDLRPLAITEQFGALDDVRVRAVLARRSPDDVAAYAFSVDIKNATGPVRYPASPVLDTLPRVCIPLRAREELFGYLWLIDMPELVDEEIATAERVTKEIVAVLQTRAGQETTAFDHEAALVTSLLDPGSPVSPTLVDEADILAFEEPLTVVTVLITRGGHHGELERSDVRLVAREVSGLRPTSRSLLGYDAASIRLVLVADSAGEDRLRPFLRDTARSAVRHRWDASAAGIGPPARDVEELRSSWRRSTFAAAVAHGRGVEQLSWSDLGCDLAFFGLPWVADTVESLSPGVTPLLSSENRVLRETLETYLDCGGDTLAAATRLSVHRTTLYYRLGRVRDILGEDWSHGTRRVGLHLALRLAWLMRSGSTPDVGG